MSKDVVPEWMRVKREIESLMAGAWHEISKLTDWVWSLEKRIEKLEKKKDKVEILPRTKPPGDN